MVAVAHTIKRHPTLRFLYLDGDITVRGIGPEQVGTVATTATHLIGDVARQGMLVDEKGAPLLHWLIVEFLSVTIKVEFLARGVRPQRTPTDDHTMAVADGHDATVEFLS